MIYEVHGRSYQIQQGVWSYYIALIQAISQLARVYQLTRHLNAHTVAAKKSLRSVTVVRTRYAGLGQKLCNMYATATPATSC